MRSNSLSFRNSIIIRNKENDYQDENRLYSEENCKTIKTLSTNISNFDFKKGINIFYIFFRN